ncbi:MAG TPA: ABC transporter ATP-binding protein [Candidatus Limnocylindria bacterium]|nr:ABC transporter ATP-binding protein [Candidatus Limnocylindria bacterium]
MNRKTFGSVWWTLRLQARVSRWFFAWKLIYSTYDGASSIAVTYVVAKLISSVTAVSFAQGATRDVYEWLGLLLALELVGVVLRNANRMSEIRFQQQMELATNERFMTKVYDLSQEQFDDEAFNTKLGRARDSLGQVDRLLDELSWSLSSAVRFVGAISAIAVVAPVVGFIIAATVIPIAFLRARQNKTYEAMYKKVEPYERVAFRTRWMLIDPTMMPEIRTLNAFRDLVAAWQKSLKKSQAITLVTHKKMIAIDAGTEVVEPVIAVGANVYFFRLLAAGSLALDRFIFLRGLLEQATSAASALAQSLQRLHELSINLRNFSEVYDTPAAIPLGKTKVQRPLTIEFQKVGFTYPGTDQPVLKDISFVIHPGSKLALVGENGAGKTTLIKLILRQYLPTSGTILVNGTDIREVEQNSYYQAISTLSQEFLTVYHLPIEDNLKLGLQRSVTQQDVEEAARLAGAYEFIKKLKHGFKSRLDRSFDDGAGLSGGQRQRLGVARALLRDGDILLLDEPTSAIDAKAEFEIFNNIYKSQKDKTTLIVSHRFSTVRKAEKIIVLENGEITEYGSHEDLLAHKGLYKEMFEAQAEGYK